MVEFLCVGDVVLLGLAVSSVPTRLPRTNVSRHPRIDYVAVVVDHFHPNGRCAACTNLRMACQVRLGSFCLAITETRRPRGSRHVSKGGVKDVVECEALILHEVSQDILLKLILAESCRRHRRKGGRPI